MKPIKEKPPSGKPKTSDTAKVPKAAMKQAWLAAKEKAASQIKESTGTAETGDDTTAADTGEKGAGMIANGGEQAASMAYRGGKKLAEKTAERRRVQSKATAVKPEQAPTAPTNTSRTREAGTAAQPRRSAPVPRGSRPTGNRPDAAAPRAAGRARPAKPGRSPKSATPAPKTGQVLRSAARPQPMAEARRASMRKQSIQKMQQSAQTATHLGRRVANAVRSAAQATMEAVSSLVSIIAAGGSIAVVIVVLVCLIAFVAGSAYGIFFAAETPSEGSVTVQQAVEQLNGEYRDYLQGIESAIPHDHQEIQANDDVYYIRWQDVLAVFSSYVSGSEDGSPVAVLDNSQLERLRQTMWDMNEVNYSTYTETVEVEQPTGENSDVEDSGDTAEAENQEDENAESDSGTESTAVGTVTQTVLLIALTHKTPDEMSATYHYTARQQEYLDLLRALEYETLWAELLGGFVEGDGEILSPADGWLPTGPLQWPLPINGSITSPFGYRTDPITGETSYHSGTDIAAPNGTPILAAADGTVVVANGVDSWGGSYGYYIKIDHGSGLQTLYAHCRSICVTAGQQVQARQVIGSVGSTGRSTGNHLHFEVWNNGSRTNALDYYQ